MSAVSLCFGCVSPPGPGLLSARPHSAPRHPLPCRQPFVPRHARRPAANPLRAREGFGRLGGNGPFGLRLAPALLDPSLDGDGGAGPDCDAVGGGGLSGLGVGSFDAGYSFDGSSGGGGGGVGGADSTPSLGDESRSAFQVIVAKLWAGRRGSLCCLLFLPLWTRPHPLLPAPICAFPPLCLPIGLAFFCVTAAAAAATAAASAADGTAAAEGPGPGGAPGGGGRLRRSARRRRQRRRAGDTEEGENEGRAFFIIIMIIEACLGGSGGTRALLRFAFLAYRKCATGRRGHASMRGLAVCSGPRGAGPLGDPLGEVR